MAQETRKDPRAKVLTVTVRYKSATLDEFIEHHSHDVSRGGMFIKTVSPFPAGTLLKIEVRIAGDQRVMQGVGRVVWKRESTEARDGAPAGMGVKFIKIDDASRGVIDQLVAKSGGAVSAFERGGGEPAAPTDAPAEPAVAAAKPVRKQTMIGLGSLGADAATSEEPKQEKPAADGGFFPETSKEADLPPPEDRTVMKQAAELLQDALREAGGSLDEVGTPAAASSSSVPPPRPIASDAPTQIRTLPSDFMEEHAGDVEKAGRRDKADADDRDSESDKPAAARASDRAAASLGVSKPGPAAGRPATSRSASASSPRAPASRPSSRPPATATRRVSVSAEEARPPEGASGGKMAVIVLAVAAIGGGLFMLSKSPSAPPEPPAAEVVPPTPATATATTVAAPAETEAPIAPSASAAAVDSAAPATSASAAPSAAPSASAELAPTVAKPKPAPVVTKPPPRPAPVAKPAAPKPPAEPTVAAPTPPAETKPAEPTPPPAEAEPKPPAAEIKPAEPKPPAAPKAPVVPKPADSDDNPY